MSTPDQDPQQKDEPCDSKNHGLEDVPQADAAFVFGADLKVNKRGEDVIGMESKMRVLAALHLYHHGKVKTIIVTGGTDRVFKERSAGEIMKDYLIWKGVPPEKIFVENTSVNTSENIENSIGILRDQGITSVLLITHEFHLLRVNQLFQIMMKKYAMNVSGSPVSCEAALDDRSPHYRRLTDHYTFPRSLIHSPKQAITKWVRELLRRILIAIDKNDRLATFLAHRTR